MTVHNGCQSASQFALPISSLMSGSPVLGSAACVTNDWDNTANTKIVGSHQIDYTGISQSTGPIVNTVFLLTEINILLHTHTHTHTYTHTHTHTHMHFSPR